MTMLMMEKMVQEMRAAATTAAAVMAKATGMKRALIVKLAPRKLILSNETTLAQTFAYDVIVETMNLYICGLRPPSNTSFVNINLRKSCKVGLRRM
jgi:hypothetical protein